MQHLLLIGSKGIIKRREIRLNHAVQLILPDLFIGGVILQPLPWLLPPGASFERSLLQQQFLQIIGGVEVCLLRRGNEDRVDLLPLEGLKVDALEELVMNKTLPCCTKPLIRIYF
jgi:hypothetical protein